MSTPPAKYNQPSWLMGVRLKSQFKKVMLLGAKSRWALAQGLPSYLGDSELEDTTIKSFSETNTVAQMPDLSS